MVTQTKLDIKPLALVASIVEDVCSLPAVATYDWMKRAATIIHRLSPDAVTTVALVVNHEDKLTIPRDFSATLGAGRLPATVSVHEELIRDLKSDSVRENLFDCEVCKPLLVRTNQPGSVFTPMRLLLPDRLDHTRLTMVCPISESLHAFPERLLCVDLWLNRGKGNLGESAYLVLEAVAPLLGKRVLKAFADVDHTVELSPKEGQVLRLLQQGMTVKQIANEMQRSPHTVHDHVKSLHRKLGASNRGELLAKTFGLFDR